MYVYCGCVCVSKLNWEMKNGVARAFVFVGAGSVYRESSLLGFITFLEKMLFAKSITLSYYFYAFFKYSLI